MWKDGRSGYCVFPKGTVISCFGGSALLTLLQLLHPILLGFLVSALIRLRYQSAFCFLFLRLDVARAFSQSDTSLLAGSPPLHCVSTGRCHMVVRGTNQTP